MVISSNLKDSVVCLRLRNEQRVPRERERERDRQTDRPTDRQTNRETARQTERSSEREGTQFIIEYGLLASVFSSEI